MMAIGEDPTKTIAYFLGGSSKPINMIIKGISDCAFFEECFCSFIVVDVHTNPLIKHTLFLQMKLKLKEKEEEKNLNDL